MDLSVFNCLCLSALFVSFSLHFCLQLSSVSCPLFSPFLCWPSVRLSLVLTIINKFINITLCSNQITKILTCKRKKGKNHNNNSKRWCQRYTYWYKRKPAKDAESRSRQYMQVYENLHISYCSPSGCACLTL